MKYIYYIGNLNSFGGGASVASRSINSLLLNDISIKAAFSSIKLFMNQVPSTTDIDIFIESDVVHHTYSDLRDLANMYDVDIYYRHHDNLLVDWDRYKFHGYGLTSTDLNQFYLLHDTLVKYSNIKLILSSINDVDLAKQLIPGRDESNVYYNYPISKSELYEIGNAPVLYKDSYGPVKDLMYVSSYYSKAKGIYILLKSIANTPEGKFNWHIVGDCLSECTEYNNDINNIPGYKDLLDTVLKRKDVFIHGYVPHEQMGELYNKYCDALLVLSSNESFSYTAYEAKKYGKLIIVNDFITADWIEKWDNTYIIESRSYDLSYDTLSEKLLYSLDHIHDSNIRYESRVKYMRLKSFKLATYPLTCIIGGKDEQ